MPLSQSQCESKYRCPGQRASISRAIHLGRLARFYPACRGCPCRDDTGPLAAAKRRQLAELQSRPDTGPVWLDDGPAGVWPNEIDPGGARRLAAAFGLWLRRSAASGETPLVVLAGDGRPCFVDLLSAAGEGLRWAACAVAEIGPATSACLAFAMDHLQAAGGLLVGNPLQGAHTIGLRFRLAGAEPCDAVRDVLAYLREECSGFRPVGLAPDRPGPPLGPPCGFHSTEIGLGRPSRRYGPRERFLAADSYLAELGEYYHGLRPLRFILQSESVALTDYVNRLCSQVACQAIPPRSRAALGEEVRRTSAHFGLRVEDDGEVAWLVDQRGNSVSAERLLLLVGRHLLSDQPGANVVLESGSDPRLREALEAAGAEVFSAAPSRRETESAMRRHVAVLGGGPSGRLWYCLGHPSPDSLRTLSLLLVLLSRSDRPVSDVLDAEAGLG